ncbi:hypothetical protein Tco_0294662 [Tanacetum coccineum]
MAHPLSPDHVANFPKVEPAQPKLAPGVPDLAPLPPDHVFDFPNGNPDEDSEEDPEEEPEEEEPEEMDMDMEVDSDDEMNDPELIFPYEAMGSPYPPPPKSNTSSDSEPEDAPAATVGTITQLPTTGRIFSGSTYARCGSSSAVPITYHLKDLVPSTMRRYIDSLHGRVLVLTRQMSTQEVAEALAQSREREGRKRMDLLDFDLGVVE